MFCCLEHFYEYERTIWYPDWHPTKEQQKKIWSQIYSSYWDAGAKEWIKWLNDNWIEYKTQFSLDNNLWLEYPHKKYKERSDQCFPQNRVYDIKIWNILLEISPTVSHNSTYRYPRIKDKLWKHPLYHAYSQMLAEYNWYHCIQVFWFDDKKKIKEWLLWLIKWRKSINARIVKRISSNVWNKFCEENHLQWKTSQITNVRYWLFRRDSDDLYAVMWFKYENETWTLQRFACLKWYHIPYWAHRLFKQFIKDYNPDFVVSQSDCSKHNWKLYDSLWFERLWYTRDYWYSTVWWNPKHYQRRTCQRKSMYRLPWFENYPKWDIYYTQHSEPELMKAAWYAWLVTAWLCRHVWFKDKNIEEQYKKKHKNILKDKR